MNSRNTPRKAKHTLTLGLLTPVLTYICIYINFVDENLRSNWRLTVKLRCALCSRTIDCIIYYIPNI